MSGEEVRRLVERIAEAEDKISRLLKLSNRENHPFTHWSLEMNLTREQVRQIYGIMDEAHNSLSSQNPMNHNQFERRVSEVLREPLGSYAHAESILRAFNQSGEYTDVYQHMRRNGMNI
jgi:Spy/CpxP family protein refolding chaperone